MSGTDLADPAPGDSAPLPRSGDFGRDGVSGLLSTDRAMRAREVSRPGPDDEAAAHAVLGELLARVEGRRPRR